MNHKIIVFVTLIMLTGVGCVQKSAKKTVIVKLDVRGIENIQTVGIRGSDKPLNWDYDYELKPLVKDSIYIGTFSLITGYKFMESKFTVNGQFEEKLNSNRKIVFSENDTTFYNARFDVME
jgi:putative oxidoreductase